MGAAIRGRLPRVLALGQDEDTKEVSSLAEKCQDLTRVQAWVL